MVHDQVDELNLVRGHTVKIEGRAEGVFRCLAIQSQQRSKKEPKTAFASDGVQPLLVAHALLEEHAFQLGDVACGKLLSAPHLLKRQMICVRVEERWLGLSERFPGCR